MGVHVRSPESIEAYCAARAMGFSQPDAYRKAFPHTKGNATTASREGRRIEKKPEVLQRIAMLKQAMSEGIEKRVSKALDVANDIALNRKWVVDQLIDNVRVAKTAIPIRDKKGEPTGDYEAINLPAANRALELLGREIGMFREAPPEDDPLDALSDEDVRKLKGLLDDLDARPGSPQGATH